MLREEVVDEDVHYCLRCKTAISGLENYIEHRQRNCQKAKKSSHDPNDQSGQRTTRDTQNDISYACNNDVDLHNASDFFSSLELKCNVSDSYNVSSKKLSTDLFPMTFEYDSDNYTETENGFYPPQSHTGGKWGPSNSLMLLSPSPNPFVSSRYAPMTPEPNNEPPSLATELNNDQSSLAPTLDGVSKLNNVNFEDKEPRNGELINPFSNVEEKRIMKIVAVSEKQKKKPEKCSESFCDLCNLDLPNEKDLLVHLFSEEHKRKSSDTVLWNEEVIAQEQKSTKVFPFQCCICQFFCVEINDLVKHIENEEHLKKVTHLRRSLFCLTCKFETFDNNEMLEHLLTKDHFSELTKSASDYHPIMIIEKTNRFYCKFCNGKCILMNDESLHLTPSRKTVFHCPHCDFSCKSNSILKCHICKAHQRSNREESCVKKSTVETKKNKNCRNICFSCNKFFKSITELKQHFKSEHSEQTLNCDKCNRLFVSEEELQNHYQSKMHQTNITKHVLKDEYNTASNTDEIYKCDRCSFVTKSKGFMCLHSAQHDGPITEVKSEENGKPQNIYLCPFCSKEFTRLLTLESHIYTHTGEKPYVCRVCQKGFTQKSAKNLHENLHPNPDTIWNCKSCPFQTSKKTILERHRLTHTKNRAIYICDVCGANFSNLSILALHTKRHINKKKYECQYQGCGQTFWTSEEMQWHSKTHSEKEFLCEVCAYSSKSKSLLIRHQRTHSGEKPYRCEVCAYASTSLSNLIRHNRIHSGVKNYSCPYCDYTCNTSENIKKHITKTKKHNGLKIYPCLFCKYSTNEYTEFKWHMVESHSQEIVDDNEDEEIIHFLYRPFGYANVTKKLKILPKPPNEKPVVTVNNNSVGLTQQPRLLTTTIMPSTPQPSIVLLPNCIAGPSILVGLSQKNPNVSHSLLTSTKIAKLDTSCTSKPNPTFKEINTTRFVPLRPKLPILDQNKISQKNSQPLLLPKIVPSSNQIIFTLNNNPSLAPKMKMPISKKRKMTSVKAAVTVDEPSKQIKPRIALSSCEKERPINLIVIDSDEEVADKSNRAVSCPETTLTQDIPLTSETLLSAMKATLGAEVMQMETLPSSEYEVEGINNFIIPTQTNINPEVLVLPITENVKHLNHQEGTTSDIKHGLPNNQLNEESGICIYFSK